MNDKVLTWAIMLTVIMIGINSFLYMGSANLYDSDGHPMNIYYGLDNYSSNIETKAEGITIDTDTSFSSSLPSQTQGIVAVESGGNPVGLDYTAEFQKLGIGVQLVMLKLGTMFPIISPITGAIVAMAFLIQGLAIAYLGSILIRGILGRIT